MDFFFPHAFLAQMIWLAGHISSSFLYPRTQLQVSVHKRTKPLPSSSLYKMIRVNEIEEVGGTNLSFDYFLRVEHMNGDPHVHFDNWNYHLDKDKCSLISTYLKT